jgi:hypothetical protein
MRRRQNNFGLNCILIGNDIMSRDSSVRIATECTSGVRFPAGEKFLSSGVQIGSETHPPSYPMGAVCAFPV